MIKPHSAKPYHINAFIDAKSFISTIENPKRKIVNQLKEQQQQNIEKNRQILAHIVVAVVYLAKQGVALRGHDETKTSNNRGNFLELLEVLAQYADDLKAHLERWPKISYMSPRSQNELITVIAHEIIRAPIIAQIRRARFFSILCDEASSGHTEYLSIVIRYVDEGNCVNEQFVKFHPVGKCTGQLLGEQIVEQLASLGLAIENCRGQGYDGAAAMSSDRCGVQAVIREKSHAAAYVHCASHCLNLVIVHACQDPDIRNVNDKISAVNIAPNYYILGFKNFIHAYAYQTV